MCIVEDPETSIAHDNAISIKHDGFPQVDRETWLADDPGVVIWGDSNLAALDDFDSTGHRPAVDAS